MGSLSMWIERYTFHSKNKQKSLGVNKEKRTLRFMWKILQIRGEKNNKESGNGKWNSMIKQSH